MSVKREDMGVVAEWLAGVAADSLDFAPTDILRR